jgi:hypothetical protein
MTGEEAAQVTKMFNEVTEMMNNLHAELQIIQIRLVALEVAQDSSLRTIN